MERLTERFSNGQAAVFGCGSNCKHGYKYCNLSYSVCPTLSEIYERLAAYEDLELEPEEIRQTLDNISTFLFEVTGNRMSKTNYTAEAMVAGVHAYFDRLCEECYTHKEYERCSVKQGRWKLNEDGSGTCDQCHFTQKGVWDFDNAQRYCGVCGALMED